MEAIYTSLTDQVRVLVDSRELNASKFQPSPFPRSRPRSNTDTTATQSSHRRLASALDTIQSKYMIVWECAELLIELGGGTKASALSPPVSVSEPAMSSRTGPSESRKNRERAITLAGDESKPAPGLAVSPLSTNIVNLARRASTERHQLSRHQLVLLEEILNNADPSAVGDLPILEESTPNRDWRWGDAMGSTVTLPSEDSQGASSTKKRPSSRLRMSGLRNMLRSLRRNYTDGSPSLPLQPSVYPSHDPTASGDCQHRNNHPPLPAQRRRAKTRADAESLTRVRPTSPFRGLSVKQKASPRRPSLASIFRLGQRSKSNETSSHIQSTGTISGQDSNSVTDEGDWDRMDSASDVDTTDIPAVLQDEVHKSDTVRDRSPHPGDRRGLLGFRRASKTRHSIVPEAIPAIPPSVQSTTSLVAENGPDVDYAKKGQNRGTVRPTPSRPSSRPSSRGGPARPAPLPTLLSRTREPNDLPDPKLAVSPDNIKPLLENSKEVLSRLQACIEEIRLLLGS